MTNAVSEVSIAAATTHFHERTAAANLRNEWHQWKGYTTSDCYYDAELEYFAIRNSTGVFDLCPMNKYCISGPDAADYLNRLVTRDVSGLRPGRVTYVAWCNDAGKLLDDGTLFHLHDGVYRLCAYEHHLAWLTAAAIGFDVNVREETSDVAALAVQGPTSCAILRDMGLDDIDTLTPFGVRHYPFGDSELAVSRTGFTGDLGYELWVDPHLAIPLWDTLFEAGRLRGIRPIGGDALDMARIEAGFLQAGVDFLNATHLVRPGRARSPFELGLGWLVDFDKPVFNGRRALLEEQRRGPVWQMVKLDIEGNKPAHHSYIYAGRKKQVGFVTSAMWSPVCKANIALASVKAPYGKPGDDFYAEIYYQREMHWSRVMAKCEVVTKPFWDP
ncbi:MAG: aminomethyl transferase family protein, partial [Gammaproteobacteria bacterium]|nr:aminomethyl transferase family protein [Gammaproteobacteria bacterium]